MPLHVMLRSHSRVECTTGGIDGDEGIESLTEGSRAG